MVPLGFESLNLKRTCLTRLIASSVLQQSRGIFLSFLMQKKARRNDGKRNGYEPEHKPVDNTFAERLSLV